MGTATTRTTFSTSYYCRQSKQNKAGLAPLELCIIINGDRVNLNLPVKFYPKDFNKKRKPVEIDNIVDQYRTKVNEAIGDIMANGQPVTAANLKSYLQTGGTKTFTLSMLINRFMGELRTTPKTYRKYELAMDYILNKIGDVEVSTITVGQCNKLYADLKVDFLPSTSAGYMTKCKTLFAYAMDNGLMKINPANGIKITKGTPTISYLSNDDISKIKALRLEDYDRLNKVRDLLLFQASTGMAYCDLVHFDNSMVVKKGDVYTYTDNRQKTGIEFTTVILPMGVEVINKYDGQLPLISNQKYNQYLKEIQKLAGISTTITTHLLRKTYAHYMLNNGVRIETVARLLGHSNTNITQRIYCRKTSDTVAAEVAAVLNQPEPIS